MKAVFIDAVNRTVQDIDLDYEEKNYKAITEKLGCDIMTLGFTFPNGDVMFVDDEGLLKNPENFIVFADYEQPLAGNAVILGSDEFGESVDAKNTAAEISPKVAFANATGVRAWFANANIERAERIAKLNEEMGTGFFAMHVPFPEI